MSITLEIVRFRVAEAAAEALLEGRDAALAALRAECPGLLQAHLARLEGDQWVDVVLWESRELALAAAEQAMSIAEFARWCTNISELLSCEHATVLANAHADA